MSTGTFIEGRGDFEVEIDKVLNGTSIRMFMCPDPECRNLHLMVGHENTDIVSVMTIPAEDVDELAARLINSRNEVLHRKKGFSS